MATTRRTQTQQVRRARQQKPATADTVAREYLRVSLDRSGQGRSTDEQHEDNEREAQRLGWVLGEPYRDDNRSASRYARKAREQFDQLVADLGADRFDAGVLVLWESSRGSRKVSEWVLLIEFCEQRGVLIHVTTHGRTYDPANGRDRRSLLEDSVDSEHETWKISQRTTRSMAANAAAGKPHGRVPFGYRRLYDPVTRRFVAQEPDPAEAPVVRELFERISAGHSLRSIAIDFERRGVTTRSGLAFSAQHLRSLAVSRTYAGERVHDPNRDNAGKASGASSAASVVPAQWEALVPRATFLSVQRILSDPARRTVRPGRARHLLSMITRCGVCGGPLVVRSATNGRTTATGQRPEQYTCRAKGCVKIDKTGPDGLETFVERVMLDYLARDDVHEELAAKQNATDDLAAVRAEIQDLHRELDDLADRVGRGELSATLAARAEPGIIARLRVAEDREKQLGTPSALRDLLAPGQDVQERWKAMPTAARREVARLLLAPDLLGQLRVARSPSPGHRVHPSERVVWLKTKGKDD